MARLLKNVMYNSVLTCINLIFTMTVIFANANVLLDEMDVWTVTGLILHGIYFLDMVANFAVLGLTNVLLSRKLVLFELLLQILAII